MGEVFGVASGRAPLGVGALVRQVAEAIGQRFGACSVQGEISGFSRASSGHCYFTLKDADASPALIRCAMFRRAASLLSFVPADGQLVELRGRLGVYEPRGELQLVVESMQRGGAGLLFEQFLRTKLRLEAEGLFDPVRKRALPRHPRSIGLVTSLGGAVLHDVVTTLARRAPHVAVIVYPSLVQGPGAAAALRAAIEAANARAETEVLLVCRGGGSMEDLWAFNDEQVVRAIAGSRLPVVSGVGHETDVSLADFAADLRAPTPTAAAELVAPSAEACRQALVALEARLKRRLRDRLDHAAQRLDRLSIRLAAPAQRLGLQAQRLRHLQARLGAAAQRAIQAQRLELPRLEGLLRRAVGARFGHDRQRIVHLDARLRALDPARVLARGYAWLEDGSQRPVMSVLQVAPGDRLAVVLADGKVAVRVDGARRVAAAAGVDAGSLASGTAPAPAIGPPAHD